MKIVINADFGGFGLSNEAMREYGRRKGINLVEKVDKRSDFVFFYENEIKEENFFSEQDIPRDDPILVETVEALTAEKAGSRFSSLKVVEIPENVDWYIEEYDGWEHIAERHRTWR